MDESPPRGTLGTVFNAARVLRELSTGPAHQQLTDLAERSGMSLPTVHRLLRSLVVAGMVEQHPRTSRYGLGPELVRLSEQYLSRLPVLKAARPYLGELRNLTKGTVTLSILVGEEVVSVDRMDGEHVGGVFRDTARLQQAMSCAAGLALLNCASGSDGAEPADAPYVIHHRRAAGFAEIAAPIQDPHAGAVAALTVTGSPTVFTDEVLHRDIAPHLLRTTAAVAGALGGD